MTSLNIQSSPSPNFDTRALPISMLVLHYTGMENGAAALARMCDPAAKVSAHYMIEEDGQIHRLVADTDRAWHAGVSSWGGVTDVNSASIGIEIVNGGHDFGLPDFPAAQIDAVIALSQDLIAQHGIQPWQVVGHSDIAPDRKQDPGEKFPWEKLAASQIGMWPKIERKMAIDRRVLFASNSDIAETRGRGVSVAQSALSYLGYGVAVSGQYDAQTHACIEAMQRRYRPELIDGNIDVEMMEILSALAQLRQSGNAADVG